MNLFALADRLRNRIRCRRWTHERAFGIRGEDLAMRFLQKQGFTIIARNYRARGGEIDLIGWEGPTLAFVEVKTRASDEVGTPERAVNSYKREYLERSAREFARRANADWQQTRFDIVTVVGSSHPQLELQRDAFGARRAGS